MNSDFPRILTLLRKEKGISQKSAATELAVSQALLSHYEKGIRECGLDFLVRCADFYGVSCDYLLGRSPDRQGSTISVDDIPDLDDGVKENRSIAGILPILNKKLLLNSINILFDLLGKAGSKYFTSEISSYLMLAVYRMFRIVYSCNPKNQEAMFSVPGQFAGQYTSAAMLISEANAMSVAADAQPKGIDGIMNADALVLSTDSLGNDYPLYISSLLNLIQNSENRIGFKDKHKK